MANKHKSQAGLSLLSTVLESFLHRHNTTIIDYESRPQFIKEELCRALLSKSIVTSSVLLLNTVKWFRKSLSSISWEESTYVSLIFLPPQFSSVTQSCLTLCDSMNLCTPGLPVHHQLLELTQPHGRWVGDAIQPFHPLSSPSPPALNLYQHQGLFQWVSSSQKLAKALGI